jgi:hypothetical protein
MRFIENEMIHDTTQTWIWCGVYWCDLLVCVTVSSWMTCNDTRSRIKSPYYVEFLISERKIFYHMFLKKKIFSEKKKAARSQGQKHHNIQKTFERMTTLQKKFV